MTDTAESPRPRASILRRVIVGVIIVSFGLAALGGIIVLLGAQLGEPAWKVLSTTSLVGAYSVAVLCCASLLGRRLQVVGLTGTAVSVVAAVMSIVALWVDQPWEAELFWDVLWTLVAATVGLSFACLLLLLADRRQRAVRIGLVLTLALFVVVFVLVVYPLWVEFEWSETYSRVLGIASILAALGAIVVPVLSLLLRDRAGAAATRHGGLSPAAITRIEDEAARRGITSDELVAVLLAPAAAESAPPANP